MALEKPNGDIAKNGLSRLFEAVLKVAHRKWSNA